MGYNKRADRKKEETRSDTPACAGPSKRNQQKYLKKKEKKRQNTQHEHLTTESSSLGPDVPQEGAPVQYTLPTASQLDSKNPDLYAILKKMPSNDYGVFAACRIPRGTRIMSEEPLISDYQGKNVASLSVIEDVKKLPRDKLLALHALPIQEHHLERYKQLLEWIGQFPGQHPDEDVHENTRQQHYNLSTLIYTKIPEIELRGEHPDDVLLEKIHLLARLTRTVSGSSDAKTTVELSTKMRVESTTHASLTQFIVSTRMLTLAPSMRFVTLNKAKRSLSTTYRME